MLVIWRSSQLFHPEPARKISTKRSSRTRSSAESDTPKPIRLGVDLDRMMDDTQHDSPHAGANNPEKPKAIKMGIDLARKLFNRPHDVQTEHLDSSIRVDRIFYVHTTNEQHDLRRRETEEDLRRRAKLDISRPITSPPPPDVTLMHRYRKRQAAWKKRSLAMKTKHVDDFRSKRWSLKTWKVGFGCDLLPQEVSQGCPNTGNTGKGLPVPFEKKAPSFRVQKQSGHERTPAIPQVNSLRSANLEISVKPQPLPQSSKNRATTFRDQRWNPLTSPTTLDVIEEQPMLSKPTHATHRHASSVTNIPQRHELGPQMPRKSASTSMLRPPTAYYNNHTVPFQHGVPNTTDQRRIPTALSTQSGPKSSAADQRDVHPFVRTQPSPTSSTFDQRQLHPLRRTQPSLRSTTSLCSVSTAPSTRSTSWPIPRVRITPPSAVMDPDEVAVALAFRPPNILEQLALLKNMNLTRDTIYAPRLDLHPILSNRAQDYVTLQLPPPPPPKPMPSIYNRHVFTITKHARPRATYIEKVEFLAPGTSAIRLISPPGLGAMACGELWASGKYKRHKTVKPGQVPAEHRFTMLPNFELDFKEGDKESMISMVSPVHVGTAYCGCAEYDAYVAVTDKRWRSVGMGRAEDGRWVVELWEPAAGAAPSK